MDGWIGAMTMNRALQYANLAGVLVLALLCAVQWRAHRRSGLETLRLEGLRQAQEGRLEEQSLQIQGLTADLDDFRERISGAREVLHQTEGRVRTLERSVTQLTVERDQLGESVTNWAAAVDARDQQLRSAQGRLQELASDRNEAVTRFNELAQKYNGVVDDLHRRSEDYRALVEKYNALAKATGKKSGAGE